MGTAILTGQHGRKIMNKEIIKLLINEYERQCIFAEKNYNISLSKKLENEIKLLELKLKELI